MAVDIIARIRSGAFTERELINLYKNNVQDPSASALIAAIERQMRGQFPCAANRLFGKKESFAVQRLEEVLGQIQAQVSVDGNKLKNGVKPGGKMLNGEKYLNVYVSYRNGAGEGGFLSLDQDTVDSELYAVVGHYQVGTDRFRDERRYTMDSFAQAVEEYVRILKTVTAGE